jgi:hypothetical protein
MDTGRLVDDWQTSVLNTGVEVLLRSIFFFSFLLKPEMLSQRWTKKKEKKAASIYIYGWMDEWMDGRGGFLAF